MIGAIIEIIAKIVSKLPIQGRRERWKNELDALKKEKKRLLRGKFSEKKATRLSWVNSRIDVLNTFLRNAESD